MSIGLNILVGVDQLLNTFLGGWPDETVSARAWRQQHKPRWNKARKVIDVLFFWQEYHCYKAYMSEVKRRQSPVEERSPQ